MRFSPADIGVGHTIQGYDKGHILVGNQTYTRSLIVSPDQIIPAWPPQSIAELSSSHIDALLALNPQMILLGTGSIQSFPDRSLYQPAVAGGIGVEIMDTRAACRTYNIIMAEGRRVVAGLILP